MRGNGRLIRRCDIAVVGGGLVGTTLVAALRGWPWSVVLIDPHPGGAPASDARSLAISHGSAELYRTLGVWDGMEPEASPIREIHVSRRGQFGFARIRAAECGVAALGYVIAARSLERRIEAVLRAGSPAGRAAAGDHERVRAAVEGVAPRGREVRVEARGPEGSIAIDARLVVGADGADSAVRRLAGLPLRAHRCDHVAIAGSLAPEHPHRGRAFERFTEWGPLALFPRGEDRCGFVWALPEAVAERFDGSGFAARLAAAFGTRLGELDRIERSVRHPLRVTHSPRITAPRTVLIGNAANALHPVGAQGFNLGLRDVRGLAGLLGEASAAGADPASVLARYGAHRRADHVMARCLTGGLLRVYGSRGRLGPAVGAAALLGLDRVAPLKRSFANLTMGAGWIAGAGAGRGAGARLGGRAGPARVD